MVDHCSSVLNEKRQFFRRLFGGIFIKIITTVPGPDEPSFAGQIPRARAPVQLARLHRALSGIHFMNLHFGRNVFGKKNNLKIQVYKKQKIQVSISGETFSVKKSKNANVRPTKL
jgi:hypothetical protein